MAKKLFQKALSVGLSLTLCASLVAPALAAATFQQLQDAINGTTEITEGAITAKTEDGVRNVTLHDDVEYGGEEDAKGITLEKYSKVVLNLNGKTIDGGYDAKTGEGGSGQSIITTASFSTLTINGADAEGEKGTITGGRSNGEGGAIKDNWKYSNVTVNDVIFTGNRANGDGGAISSKGPGSLSVNNTDFIGNAAGNETGGDGGAISTYGRKVTLTDVTMIDNESKGSGGGLWAGASANVAMEGNIVILNNKAELGTDDIFQYHGISNDAVITGKPDKVTYDGLTYYKEETKLRDEDFDDYEYGDGEYDNYTGTMTNYVHKCTPGDPVRENVVEPQVGVPGSYDLVVRCRECNKIISSKHVTISALPATPGATPIDDERVPLAGIFTRGDAIGYLWQQAGEPEAKLSDFPDVPEDHEWAVAIGWAQDMGIALADEEGNFRPDDLVLRSTEDVEGELQEFLNRYAVYAGVELDEGELFIELEGAADDVIMGEEAQVIFDDFFAKLAAALAQAA